MTFLVFCNTIKLRQSASTVERGIWDNLSLCCQAVVTQNGSRKLILIPFKERAVLFLLTGVEPQIGPQQSIQFSLDESPEWQPGTYLQGPKESSHLLLPEVDRRRVISWAVDLPRFGCWSTCLF